ncbi:formate dehydrogenase accessory sulfurtransferase FdhD [Neopusillimonas aromaticivorans]|uniref:formate dehydrogenase accessory sulfurtransferase FdhD n=1 Tax=Neopusillimonas aromaticivorans TaxID=2979868 RepID=UPI002599C06B|nr:formate dehydrogenase accessory sulfurtransferase FdhD [Neopusillimonas aromaticivorans]WJJ92904.1 formate dehydrogenase accessory sulfurtransferase FdhD [Neopusillimonas aromaticivorans]
MPDSVLSPVVETPVWRYRQTGLAPGQRLTVEQVSATDPVGATNAPDTGLMATIDHIADEVAVAMEYNGISHATVLATPQNLDDLARGFSLTEGIIRTPADIYDIEAVPHPNGITLQITIASACLNTLKQRRRTLAGTTGCGLCGLESLGDVERVLPTAVAPVMPLQPGALLAASLQLRDNQPLHQQTGATHAAGWANASGQLVQVMEDVGRHNALDKLVGYLARFPELRERGGL